MGLLDKLKRRDDSPSREPSPPTGNIIGQNGYAPEFTFIRSDTASMEIIQPGDHHPADPAPPPRDDAAHLSPSKEPAPGGLRRSLSIFHASRSRSASVSSQASSGQRSAKEGSGSRRRRLSERLHLRHHAPESSDSVPENLPAIVAVADGTNRDAVESQWEQRATLLAGQNELARSGVPPPSPGAAGLERSMASLDMAPPTPTLSVGAAAGSSGSLPEAAATGGDYAARSRSASRSSGRTSPQAVSSKQIDEDIKKAIRLHEEGDVKQSTVIFRRLADKNGANNPLSQIMFGLALLHGWGCDKDQTSAVAYLSTAASNAAFIEELALQSGRQKGGAAKGELVLAIFELANCFRNGWGTPLDLFAAKQYYETAANLGDADAMNEVAWCYLKGIGCEKDKFAAARYYRLAENANNKTMGNSWIWKEKYDPDKVEGKKKKK